eukprot:758609-Hanusia_phi.AAC.4
MSSLRSAVWVSSTNGGWVEAILVNTSEDKFSVRFKDGEKVFSKDKHKFYLKNPPEVEAADDFLTLPNLDEPNILHSLRVRYGRGHVYSYTGKILIAVNPWKRVNIYSPDILQKYVKGQVESPHIFAVAINAYRSMLNDLNSQCVLISGESGSGKTESTKYVLSVLTAIGVSGQAKDNHKPTVADQIMLGNPVLESFGNAKTLRNHNSSRFGKWIEVVFDGSVIAGAGIKTYLLEKSRVVDQIEGERNYHIFYECCAAASSGVSCLKDLGLDAADCFACTRTCTEVESRDDLDEFKATKGYPIICSSLVTSLTLLFFAGAMDKMGFKESDQRSIFSAVAAIMHLSNVEFGEEIDWDGNSVATLDVKSASIVQAAKLLKVMIVSVLFEHWT